jgi:hypothetical protein
MKTACAKVAEPLVVRLLLNPIFTGGMRQILQATSLWRVKYFALTQ